MRDIHEVFGGGMRIDRCGWETQLGPGRHPVSSAYFWYFQNPAGALIEYYADEDVLTPEWQPREFEPDRVRRMGGRRRPRRQHAPAEEREGAGRKFMTERKS